MPSPTAVRIELSREEREVLEGWTPADDRCSVIIALEDRACLRWR